MTKSVPDRNAQSLGYVSAASRNVFWNLAGQAWTVGLSMLITPYVVNGLGADAYGLLMTANVIVSYFGFSEFGLGQASTKYIAEHAARDEWDETNRIFWTSMAAYVALGGGVVLAITGIASVGVRHWLRVPSELQESAATVLVLAGVGLMVAMLTNAPAAIVRGLHRFDLVNAIAVASGTIQGMVTVCLVSSGFSAVGVAVGNVGVGCVTFGSYLLVAGRLARRSWLPDVRWATLRRLVQFGAFVTVSDIAAPILTNAEKVVLASSVSVGAVGHYGVAYNLATVLGRGSAAFGAGLLPSFSALQGMNAGQVGSRFNVAASRLIVFLLAPPAAFLVVFSREVLTWWVGPAFAVEGATALSILALAMVVNAGSWSSVTFLRALGHPRMVARIHILEVLVYVPVVVACVRYWGVTGAAIAWLIRVVGDTGAVLMAVDRVSDGEGNAASGMLRRGVPIVVGTVGALWMLKTELGRMSGWLFVLVSGVFCMGVFVIAWRLGMDAHERQVLREALRSR